MAKIRIKKLPQAKNGAEVNMRPALGLNSKNVPFTIPFNKLAAPNLEVNKTLQGVDPELANLEAEKGETVVTNLNKDGIPEHYKIGGDRHSEGGTPLNLPPNSFIFSRDPKLKVKDPNIQKDFGMTEKKSGYTFAQMAKKYDINKYREQLQKNPDKIQADSAEAMIANYNLKLGKLALVQESLKGFPQGIPQIAMPYLIMSGINPEEMAGTKAAPDQQNASAKFGMETYQTGGGNCTDAQKQDPSSPCYDPTFVPLTQTNTGANQWTHHEMEWKRKMGFEPQSLANGILAGGNALANIFEGKQRRKEQEQLDNLYSGDSTFMATPANQKQRGDYNPVGTMFGEFRPDQRVPVQFSGYNFGSIGSGMYTKFGGFMAAGGELSATKAKEMLRDGTANGKPLTAAQKHYFGFIAGGGKSKFQDGGEDNIVTKLRRSDRVVFNPNTQKYEVYNIVGKKVGVLGGNQNVVNQVVNQTAPQTTPQTVPTDNSQQQNPTVTTTKTKTATFPTGAKKFDLADDPNINPDDVKNGLVYIKGTDGKYYQAKGYEADESTYVRSLSGATNYKPVYGTLDDDIVKGNEILTRLEQSGAASKVKDDKVPGGYRWTVLPSAAGQLSIPEKEFMTKLSSVGTGIPNPDNTKTASMLGAVSGDNGMVIQWQKPSDKGTYGWADPQYMEYQYWKAKNYGKTATDYEALDDASRIDNRKNMLKFYGYDPTTFTEDQLKDPNVLYTKEMISGKKGTEPKYDDKNNLINGADLGLVGANQAIFHSNEFRPSASDDWKLGLEHLDEYQFKNKIALGDAAPETAVEDAVKKAPLATQYPVPPDQWWLQDIIKTAGAFSDKERLKKYMPWQATPDTYLPTPTFYDPNRELAANAELANIGTQAAQIYSGPQAFNSRFSQIQGAAGKNAADTMSKYNNLNVGIANEFAVNNAGIMNQAALNKAGLATALYDKTTIANQQFDQAKNQARQELRQSYIDAITNKNYTANLNDLYPQYAVNPAIGGRIAFTHGRDLNPEMPQTPDIMKQAQEYLKQYPSFTPQQAFDAAKLSLGYQNPVDETLNQQQQLQMTYPGMTGAPGYGQ
jgi:hypothetical protein